MDRKLNQREKQKRIVSFILIIMVISVTATILIKSSYFNIKEIEVKNNNIVTRDEVITLANITNQNIFLLSKQKVETNIKNNPYIDEVKINRKLPNKIIVDIKEKDVRGIVRLKNAFVDIDSKGRMVHTVNKFPDGKLILVEGIDVKEYIFNENVTNDERKLNALINILQLFVLENVKKDIEKVDIKDPYSVIIKTKKGIDIDVGDTSNLEYKISFAYTLLDNENVKGKQGIIKVSSDGTAVFNEYKRWLNEKD